MSADCQIESIELYKETVNHPFDIRTITNTCKNSLKEHVTRKSKAACALCLNAETQKYVSYERKCGQPIYAIVLLGGYRFSSVVIVGLGDQLA